MISGLPSALYVAVIGSVAVATSFTAERQASPSPTRTQIVLLGTGNPPADPDRSGPATAVVVNGTTYLVDFGAGVVRRAKAAAVDRGIPALEPVNLRVAFVTHLHSDHTVGYPDLILTPWVLVTWTSTDARISSTASPRADTRSWSTRGTGQRRRMPTG